MFKQFCAYLLLCLFLLPAASSCTDLIDEPDNDFFEQHQGEIVLLGRSFVANGDEGGVPVRDTPGAASESARLQSGEVVYAQYSCLYDGAFWGYAAELSGWVELSLMLVRYDYISFEEDHLSEFYTYGGDYAEIKKARAAVAWAWPGTDVPPLWTYEDLDIDSFLVTHAFMDQDGREWGFVSYQFGGRNTWVCLSDPLNSDIPAFSPAPAPSKWETDTTHIDTEAGHSNSQDAGTRQESRPRVFHFLLGYFTTALNLNYSRS